MNKIKFLKFDSVCLIAVYPSTVIVEHNYEICGGKCRYMARARVPTEGLYQASFFFPSPRRQQPPNPLIRRLLNILFYNYKKKIGSNYNFVKIDTGNGRYTKNIFAYYCPYSEICGLLNLLFWEWRSLHFISNVEINFYCNQIYLINGEP